MPSRSSRLLLNFCFSAFRGVDGIFYFFVDKSVDIYYNISMKNGNDFLMRFFADSGARQFSPGKITKETRGKEKNKKSVEKIAASQKRKPCSKKGSHVPKKEAMLGKRKPCSKKGSHVGKKEAMFQKRKPCWKKGRHVPKKEAMLEKRKACSKKGSHVGKKESMLQKRKPCWKKRSHVSKKIDVQLALANMKHGKCMEHKFKDKEATNGKNKQNH